MARFSNGLDVNSHRYWRRTPQTDQINSWIGAPLVFKDRVIGLLSTLIIAFFFYSVFLRGSGALGITGAGAKLGALLDKHARTILWLVLALAAILAVVSSQRSGRALLKRLI